MCGEAAVGDQDAILGQYLVDGAQQPSHVDRRSFAVDALRGTGAPLRQQNVRTIDSALRPVTKTSQAKPEGDDKNSRTVRLSFSGTKSGSRRQNN